MLSLEKIHLIFNSIELMVIFFDYLFLIFKLFHYLWNYVRKIDF